MSSHAFVNEEHADRIQIPIYMGTPGTSGCTSFHLDVEHGVHPRGPEEAHRLSARQHGAALHRVHDEMVRWHEYWLKGKDNGIMDEPRVKVYVMGIEKWRFEEEWPPKRAKHVEFYLQPGGGLTPEGPGRGRARRAQPAGPLSGSHVYCLRYSTGTLDHDVEMMGELSLPVRRPGQHRHHLVLRPAGRERGGRAVRGLLRRPAGQVPGPG